MIQQVALTRSGEIYKMWHFVTKHQPTDLFLFRLLSDGSDFDGPLRGFQEGKKKPTLLSTDAHGEILSDAGLRDNKHLIRTLLQDVF